MYFGSPISNEIDQEKYESCDILIELIDSAFWQVFYKNEELINRLAKKFNKIESDADLGRRRAGPPALRRRGALYACADNVFDGCV